jgi:hypothetical protein
LTLDEALERIKVLEKALLACEWGGSEYQAYCDVCHTFVSHDHKLPIDVRYKHAEDCVFNTISRPTR